MAILGNFTPRQCGIATFSSDLAHSISGADQSLVVDVVAMSDKPDYEYPSQVCYQIPDQDCNAYMSAADFLNRGRYEVLSVQHEYGIFGGEAGSHVLSLLREARMPIVSTLHTVLREPSPAQRVVMDELLELSERVVVMSNSAVRFLTEVHGVCPTKIDLIHHGIPKIDESARPAVRKELGINGPMILTFGLLSPDKGVQHAIEAMPKILKNIPDATYVVVGATHPTILAQRGDEYSRSLHTRVADLHLEPNVQFVERFVTKEELVGYLSAMDYYVTPYLNPHQITSGTLAYAVGAGKAVISTPYRYAEELLSDGRGVLVPFKDPDSIANAVIELESDPEARQKMGHAAAMFGKQMEWGSVGKAYVRSLSRARADSAERLRSLLPKPWLSVHSEASLPERRLGHLKTMSDDTGILQHAVHCIPNRREGYCVDDNARALLFTLLLESEEPLSPELSLLQGRYLSFVLDAHNSTNGRFRNFMSYSREWLEPEGSEDSQGRSIWALGACVNRSKTVGRYHLARDLFERTAPNLKTTTSPRTWAYGVLGLCEYLRALPDDHWAYDLMRELANRIWRLYKTCRTDEWPWFEKTLTYANARLPHALIEAGAALDTLEMLTAGLRSLKWLMDLQTGPEGVFAPIGSDQPLDERAKRHHFDQQPIEAWASISACLDATRVTGDSAWLDSAHHAFRWFLGENMLSMSVYDANTGGCRDGLHADRVNQNQGAESTLAFLCSLTELKAAATPVSAAALPRNHEIRQI